MPGYFLIDGQAYPVGLSPRLVPVEPGAVVASNADQYWVHLEGAAYELVWRDALTHHVADASRSDETTTRSAMPGMVIAVHVTPGDHVTAGDVLMVIESMKLETALRAPQDGVIEAVYRGTGDSFERDAPLVSMKPEDV